MALLLRLILSLQFCATIFADAYQPLLLVFYKSIRVSNGKCAEGCRSAVKELATKLEKKPSPCWQPGARVCVRSGWEKDDKERENFAEAKRLKVNPFTYLGPGTYDVTRAMLTLAQCSAQVPVSTSSTPKSGMRQFTSMFSRLTMCTGHVLAEAAVNSLQNPSFGMKYESRSFRSLTSEPPAQPSESKPESKKRKRIWQTEDLCHCIAEVQVQSSIVRMSPASIAYLSPDKDLCKRHFELPDGSCISLEMATFNDRCQWDNIVESIQSLDGLWLLTSQAEDYRPDLQSIMHNGKLTSAASTFRVLGPLFNPSLISKACRCPLAFTALDMCHSFEVKEQLDSWRYHPAYNAESSIGSNNQTPDTGKGKGIAETPEFL